jgi:hypothetical protein
MGWGCIISAGSMGAPPRAGSMGMSSTLLMGVPYSYEASRSPGASGGKAKPRITHVK